MIISRGFRRILDSDIIQILKIFFSWFIAPLQLAMNKTEESLMDLLTRYELEIEKAARERFGETPTSLIFRGQSDENWFLDSSAERRLKKSGREFNAKELLRYLRENLIGPAKRESYDRQNGKEFSDLELLAKLQHHQAATCLIDFTHNFHIALWFACVPNDDKDGKVFIVDSGNPRLFEDITPERSEASIEEIFNASEEDNFPFQKKVLYWQPPAQSNRIIAQHSCFIFSSEKIPARAYTEITIKKKDKPRIELALKRYYGLDNKSVYRDFTGFAYANNQDQLLQRTPAPVASEDSVVKIFTYIQANEMAKRGEYEKAVKTYDRAIALDPDFADAYYNRGLAKIHLKEFQEAIEDFDKAITLKPDDIFCYLNRGVARDQLKEFQGAIEDFDKAIDLDSEYPYSYVNRGIAKARLGEHKKAVEDFDKAIALKSDDAAFYLNRGIAKARLGEHKKAIEDFDKAIELKPDDAESYSNRGESNKKLGNTKQSEEDFAKAEKLRRKTISKIHPEKLQDIKNRLKNSYCALCESNELEIEAPEDRIRSIFPPHGGDAFSGLIIVCRKCKNSSYYDLERDCFGDAITSSF